MVLKTKKNLKNHLQDWLRPHADNGYRPYALRARGLATALLLILGLQFVYNLTTAQTAQVLGYATNISAGEVISLTNSQRSGAGLAPLSPNAALSQAAAAKASHMFANNYWAHVSPSGVQPWYFIGQAGYSYVYAGENLAKDFSTSSGVVNGWMASGPHAQNILNSKYRDIGVAVMNGSLQGSQTTLVVAFYGTPPAAPAPQLSVQAAPAPAPEPAPAPQPAAPKPKPKPKQKSEPEPQYQKLQLDKVNQVLTNYDPPEVDYGVFRPMRIVGTLDWGRFATIGVLGMLATTGVMQHTVVWRQQRKQQKGIWFKSRPLLQTLLLVAAIAFTIVSSFGSIH